MIDDFNPRGRRAHGPPHNRYKRPIQSTGHRASDSAPAPATAPVTPTPKQTTIEKPAAPLEFKDTRPAKKRMSVLHYLSWKSLSKKQKFLVAGVTVLIALLIGGGVFAKTHRKKPAPPAPPVVQEKKTEPPAPTTEISTLSGLAVPIGTNQTPVTGIMIENSPDARPQAGLKDASVVFEAIAEGGITRFLALFQDTQPDYVGPIRSVRPYYIDWLLGFDAAVAHVGGSPEALQKINSLGVKDLDQFYNSAAYSRVNSRYAPHNVYSSLSRLLDAQKNKGWTQSTFTGFLRKPEKAIDTPTAGKLDFAISSYLYNVHYDYDKSTNTYKRNEGNKPHVDERSGIQISPKVVIAIVVPYSIQSDNIHSVYGTIGSGKAYIFQDGGVTEGIWEKTDAKSQIRFGDANGSPLAINPGQTWISAVSEAPKVTYTP